MLEPPHRPTSALNSLAEIAATLEGKRAAVFLDYDGTLTPIVQRPELAVLSEEMRGTVRSLAQLCVVAVVSGRDRADVQRLVGLDSLYYAGSHGFDIAGPGGFELQHSEGAKRERELREAAAELRGRLTGVEGALVEAKRYAIAVHYRLVADAGIPRVRRVVDEVTARYPSLRRTGGKKVFELRPRVDWHKGKAVLWLLEGLRLNRADVVPFYLGDDETDEDVFAALANRGVGIFVGEDAGSTQARYTLRDPTEARTFLQRLIDILKKVKSR